MFWELVVFHFEKHNHNIRFEAYFSIRNGFLLIKQHAGDFLYYFYGGFSLNESRFF